MEKRSLERKDTSAWAQPELCEITLRLWNRYFGRAKDLPGVRELFQSKKREEDEENQAQSYYKKFTNQGPAYFGDLDESDDKLLSFETHAEEEGSSCSTFRLRSMST